MDDLIGYFAVFCAGISLYQCLIYYNGSNQLVISGYCVDSTLGGINHLLGHN